MAYSAEDRAYVAGAADALHCRGKFALSVCSAELHNLVASDPTNDHVRHVAAATIMRVPDCMFAIVSVVQVGAGLELMTLSRTIVELAIVACWVGMDDNRARLIWPKSNEMLAKGYDRAKVHLQIEKVGTLIEAFREARGVVRRPSVERMAMEAVEPKAKFLYDTLYYPLSAAAHGDLRWSKITANLREDSLVPMALGCAIDASDVLLEMVSRQLGLNAEWERFLSAQPAIVSAIVPHPEGER